MLWNWYTVDSCFLSATWHNKTKGMFAGSVIGVFVWCMAIELVRRLGREYDRRIVLAAAARVTVDLLQYRIKLTEAGESAGAHRQS